MSIRLLLFFIGGKFSWSAGKSRSSHICIYRTLLPPWLFSPGSTYPSLRYCMIHRIERGRTISDIRRRSRGIEGIFSPVLNRCRLQNLPEKKKERTNFNVSTKYQSTLYSFNFRNQLTPENVCSLGRGSGCVFLILVQFHRSRTTWNYIKLHYLILQRLY